MLGYFRSEKFVVLLLTPPFFIAENIIDYISDIVRKKKGSKQYVAVFILRVYL